jgi:hypothetical protein
MPYGWENMQSSSDRHAFDRADALNSSMPNERDIGAVLYWAPPALRRFLREAADSDDKGSGEFGILALGLFNGQGANRPEANDRLHAVARATYPFRLPGRQVLEASVQGYGGRYVVADDERSPGLGAPREFADERVAGTLALYPRPIGLQAEWNVGRGPEFDPAGRTIRTRGLHGGYVMLHGVVRRGAVAAFPYVRAQRYDGGKKFEMDARRYRVREVEAGVEWQPTSAFDVTLAWTDSRRATAQLTDPTRDEAGRTVRLQVQVNY